MSSQNGPAACERRHQNAPVGVCARFVGVLFAPRETFAGVAAEPRWFGILALTVLVAVACAFGFLSTETGRQALLDAEVNRLESFGFQVTDELYQRMEQRLFLAQYAVSFGAIVYLPVMYLIATGILALVFGSMLGGEASFRQVFAVVAHGGAIATLERVFVTPLNYVRESMDNATNLAVFLPMLDESSLVARMLGTIDVFVVWQVVVVSIGLGVLYRRTIRPIATSLLAAYGVVALAVAAVMSVFGGS